MKLTMSKPAPPSIVSDPAPGVIQSFPSRARIRLNAEPSVITSSSSVAFKSGNETLTCNAEFDNGLSLNGVFGQSYHLAGDNPYARTDDLTNAGEESGLETKWSDYVGSLAVSSDFGLFLNTQARFDEADFDLRRTDTTLTYSEDAFALSANYTFIDAQPEYGFSSDRQQIGFSGRLRLNENWNLHAGAQYNIESDLVVSDRIGLSYHDECFTFTLAFNESRSSSVSETSRSVTFSLGLRTIGDYKGQLTDSVFQHFEDDD